MRVIRGGFEPRRGRGIPPGFEGPRNDHALGMQHPRMAQNRRDVRRGTWLHLGRAEFFAPPDVGGKSHWAFPRFEHEHEDDLGLQNTVHFRSSQT